MTILKAAPYVGAYDESKTGVDNWTLMPNAAENPKVKEDVMNRHKNNYSVGSNAYIDLTPVKGLTISTRGNMYTNFNVTDEFQRVYSYSPTVQNPISSIYKQVEQQYGWEWQNFANYTKTIADDHNFNVMGGMESHYTKWTTDKNKYETSEGDSIFFLYFDNILLFSQD